MRHFILCLHNPGRFTAGLLCGLLLQGLAGAATMERPDNEMRRTLIEAVNSTDSFADRFAAEVWLTDMLSRLGTRIDDSGEAVTILKTAHYEALRARIQPELVLAIMDVESNFDRYAISSAGAQGLMQIMPFWLEEIGRPDDNLMDIGTNLRFGCTILGIYLKREGGNMRRALARYNGSVGEHWYPNRVFNALRKRWYPQ